MDDLFDHGLLPGLSTFVLLIAVIFLSSVCPFFFRYLFHPSGHTFAGPSAALLTLSEMLPQCLKRCGRINIGKIGATFTRPVVYSHGCLTAVTLLVFCVAVLILPAYFTCPGLGILTPCVGFTGIPQPFAPCVFAKTVHAAGLRIGLTGLLRLFLTTYTTSTALNLHTKLLGCLGVILPLRPCMGRQTFQAVRLFRFFGLFRLFGLFLLGSRITAVLDHLTGCAISGISAHTACGCFHGNCPVTPCMHMHRGLFCLVCQTHRVIISNNIHGNSIGHPVCGCRNDSGAFLLTCHDTPAHGSYLCVGRLP